jgi:hypothetical protein
MSIKEAKNIATVVANFTKMSPHLLLIHAQDLVGKKPFDLLLPPLESLVLINYFLEYHLILVIVGPMIMVHCQFQVLMVYLKIQQMVAVAVLVAKYCVVHVAFDSIVAWNVESKKNEDDE